MLVLFSKKSNKLKYYQVRHNEENNGYGHVSVTIKGEEFNPNTLFMKCNNNSSSYMEMEIFAVETYAL